MANNNLIDNEGQLAGKYEPIDTAVITPGQAPASPVPNEMPQFFSGSISPLIQHDTSFVGTEVGSPRIPKFSLMPFGPQNNPQIAATVKSINDQGSSGGGGLTKVPFSDITTGDNTGALMRVAGLSTLTYYQTGTVNANEIGGIGVAENVPDHPGQILISQPGNETAVWADPQVQGLYAAGSDIDNPPDFIAPTTIQPVLIGGRDPNGKLQDIGVDSAGNIRVSQGEPAGTSTYELLTQILFEMRLTNRILLSSLEGSIDFDDFVEPTDR